jgi:hypothetical protein
MQGLSAQPATARAPALCAVSRRACVSAARPATLPRRAAAVRASAPAPSSAGGSAAPGRSATSLPPLRLCARRRGAHTERGVALRAASLENGVEQQARTPSRRTQSRADPAVLRARGGAALACALRRTRTPPVARPALSAARAPAT